MDFCAERIIKQRLSSERASHSVRVLDTALELAEGSKIDLEKVRLAALLHDYAKEVPPEKMLLIAREQQLLTCAAEEAQPDLLHAPVGSWLCRSGLGIEDEEILQAIRYHTTGRKDMSALDIIIYLADLIEPGRSFDKADELRRVCRQDIYQGLLMAFDLTICHVIERRFLIHPFTVEARNSILLKIAHKDIKTEE